VLVVLVNGREIGRDAYSRDGGFETVAFSFDTKPGSNAIVLPYRAAETAGTIAGRSLQDAADLSGMMTDAAGSCEGNE
jgi:hypothetical protein